jgi:hypothetical protein
MSEIMDILQASALKTGWTASQQLRLVCEYIGLSDVADDFKEYLDEQATITLSERQEQMHKSSSVNPYEDIMVEGHIHFSHGDVGIGPWKVVLYGVGDSHNWYIYNLETKKQVKIGRVGAKRTNYRDKAHEEARRRNAVWAEIHAGIVTCSICGKPCAQPTAHLHQDGWIGDECCWDDRLYSSE